MLYHFYTKRQSSTLDNDIQQTNLSKESVTKNKSGIESYFAFFDNQLMLTAVKAAYTVATTIAC